METKFQVIKKKRVTLRIRIFGVRNDFTAMIPARNIDTTFFYYLSAQLNRLRIRFYFNIIFYIIQEARFPF